MDKLGKPPFHLFKNIGYALVGLQAMLRTETSFRIQLGAIFVVTVGLVLAPVTWRDASILFASMWLIPFAEAVNTAIERVVDLVTEEHHPLAGEAKDIGALIVLIAFVIVVMVWGIVWYGIWVL